MPKEERLVTRLDLEPSMLEAEIEVATEYCENTCPVRESLLPRGLLCPFVIRQALGDASVAPRETHVIKNVAQNTWIHCVSDVKRQDEPVILITKEQISHTLLPELFE